MKNEYTEVAVSKLKHHPRNPRKGDVDLIVESIKANGVYKPLIVQRSTMFVIAGNHTLKAIKRLKLKTAEVCLVDCDDAKALRILLMDNRSNDVAGYDEALLTILLKEVLDESGSLEGTGYTDDDVRKLLSKIDDRDPKPDDEEIAAKGLALINVVIGEPKTKVKAGEVYRIDKKHHVCILDVHTDHQQWIRFVKPETLILPRPGPTALISLAAANRPLLILEPDPYLAGLIIDKYIDIKGTKGVRKTEEQ